MAESAERFARLQGFASDSTWNFHRPFATLLGVVTTATSMAVVRLEFPDAGLLGRFPEDDSRTGLRLAE